jgi:hypothetical protein
MTAQTIQNLVEGFNADHLMRQRKKRTTEQLDDNVYVDDDVTSNFVTPASRDPRKAAQVAETINRNLKNVRDFILKPDFHRPGMKFLPWE